MGRAFRRGALALLAIGLLAAGVWGWRLHHTVEAAWARHAPSVPSTIYAAPTALYPGRDLDREGLEEELLALGYRRTDGPLVPGTFRRGGPELEVHLRHFDRPPPREDLETFPLRVRFTGGRIAALEALDDGREVWDLELEPRRVATLLDDRRVRRDPVPLAGVPPLLVQAVLAVEDRRFWDHGGVDPARVAGAALHDLRVGRLAQGGSTLTQQLVKNYWLTPERSFARKAREAAMAILLEASHAKREILEAYLNAIYLGRDGTAGIAGVGAASQHYFGRDVGELGLAEAALLAGMIQAPNRYDPFRHPERARERRDLVLALMERQERITASEREAAASRPLPQPPRRRPIVDAPWYVAHVRDELADRYPAEQLERDGLRIFTAMDPRAQSAAETAVRDGLARLEAVHPRLASASDEGGRLQAALVALDPRTGDLLALVGGRDWSESSFPRAGSARRQPGSLFKPFVYLTALADTSGRWTLASTVRDSSVRLRSGGETWEPENYDGLEHGTVTLREALVRSYNLATVRLALEVGLERVVGTARELGVEAPLRPVPSLALGAFEVTPLEMASAYASLAGEGVRPEPLSVLRVVDPGGRELEAEAMEMHRVSPSGPVHLVTSALQEVLETGTAAVAREMGYRGTAAGKTGTTNGYRDAWFVGYTPDLVALVWVGFDDNRPIGLSGAAAALPLWLRFVEAYDERGRGTFVPPAEVVEYSVETPDGECRPELFLQEAPPEETC